MSLFEQGFGDCRHKAAAAERLLVAGGITAKKNWCSLTGLIYPFLRKYWLFCRKPRVS
jgi:hypothetical protein